MGRQEPQLLHDAEAALDAAGYSIVEREPRIEGLGRTRPDLIAYGLDSSGEFGPRVLVEVKSGGSSGLENALVQLSTMAGILGTETNLILTEDGWHQARPGFIDVDKIGAPPAAIPGPGRVSTFQHAVDLLPRLAWQLADQFRGSSRDPGYAALKVLLEDASRQSNPKLSLRGRDIVLEPAAFANAWITVAQKLTGSDLRSAFTPPAYSQVVAGLADLSSEGLTIFDPFAGHGGTLAAAAQLAKSRGFGSAVSGFEISEPVTGLANTVLRLAGADGVVERTDSFGTPWPEVDRIVSIPPFGLRAASGISTPIGTVRDAEVAAMALAAQALKPNGRAVLLTSRSWTYREGDASRLRSYLSERYRVVALIGLPATLSQFSSLPLLMTVIDLSDNGPTLVGDLGDDWLEELSDGGAVWSDIDEVRNHR